MRRARDCRAGRSAGDARDVAKRASGVSRRGPAELPPTA